MSVFEAGALASAICTAMATRGGAARAASDPAAFPAATTGSAATWDEAATAVSVPVNIEFAPVFEPVRTAPTALSQGVSSTRPAGSIAPMASLMPVRSEERRAGKEGRARRVVHVNKVHM